MFPTAAGAGGGGGAVARRGRHLAADYGTMEQAGVEEGDAGVVPL